MTVYLRHLQELCIHNITKVNPATNPEKAFWYIDISSIDNITKTIATPTWTIGKSASVRARQVVYENDVLLSTTRPNLNAVALVTKDFHNQICSTGFTVLRCGSDLDPDYLYHIVRSKVFIDSLTQLVQGALYPAVTNKQVFAQSIPWVPLNKQRRIAAQLKAQLAEVDKARQAAEVQLRDAQFLQGCMLETVFAEVDSAPRKKIGAEAETKSGSTPSRGQKIFWEPAEIPWVKTAEVAFAPITHSEEGISKQALADCSLRLLPKDTVLIAMYGQGKTRGQSAILKIKATTNQACFAILPNEICYNRK